MNINEITEAIVGAAIEVHRALAYLQCLDRELQLRASLLSVSNPCRWFTKASDGIVDIEWTSLLPTLL